MTGVYTIVCENVSVDSVQDILTVISGTTTNTLLAVELAANGQTIIGNVPIRISFLGGTVTVGSGGSSVTPKPVVNGTSAAGSTAAINNTTQTTGTVTEHLVASQFNPIIGYYWQPPPPQANNSPTAASGKVFVLSIEAIPLTTLNISATMWFAEA